MHYRPSPALLTQLVKNCTRIGSALLVLLAAGIIYSHAAPPHLTGDDKKPVKPDISQRTQIRFLTGTDFSPFNTLSAQGRLSGYNVDLVRALCQELEISSRCQIEARPWSELIPAMQNNEADALIAGLMPDREKRTFLNFTRAYLSLPARFVTTKTTQTNRAVFSPDEKNIGVISGSAHEAILKAYFPKAKSLPYTKASPMYQDLKNGKIQFIFGDAMSLSLWMSPASGTSDDQDGSCCRFAGGAYPAPEFLGQGMTIALRKQDSDLRLALNNALSVLERKGVLDDLYLRYFPVDFY